MEEEIVELKKKLKEHEERILALEKIIKKKGPGRILSDKKSIEDLLIELKGEGFFNERKTISQILDAIHAKGRIAKITDLPKYLLKLVRNNVLKRERMEIGKKKTWVYFA